LAIDLLLAERITRRQSSLRTGDFRNHRMGMDAQVGTTVAPVASVAWAAPEQAHLPCQGALADRKTLPPTAAVMGGCRTELVAFRADLPHQRERNTEAVQPSAEEAVRAPSLALSSPALLASSGGST
jgi:hypothetical protein